MNNMHEDHNLLYVEQIERTATCELDGKTLFVQENTDDSVMEESIYCADCGRYIAVLELGITKDDLTIIWA